MIIKWIEWKEDHKVSFGLSEKEESNSTQKIARELFRIGGMLLVLYFNFSMKN